MLSQTAWWQQKEKNWGFAQCKLRETSKSDNALLLSATPMEAAVAATSSLLLFLFNFQCLRAALQIRVCGGRLGFEVELYIG